MKKRNIAIIIVLIFFLSILGLLIYRKEKMITQIDYENVLEIGSFVRENNRTLTGGQATYMNPIIPVGFKPVNDGASWEISGNTIVGWNDGLIIEDENGSQFVWIPVDGNKVPYEKWCYDSLHYGPSYKDVTGEDVSSGIDEMEQIEKYQGFWIARYESGRSDLDYVSPEINDVCTGIELLIKKDAQPWNYISYTNAKIVAEEYINNEYVRSSLLTGTQFDTAMKWIENDGYNITNDSISWGNYFNNLNVSGYGRYTTDSNYIGQTWHTGEFSKDRAITLYTGTGSYEDSQVKNIYDLAGSLREWTTEEYFTGNVIYHISRGGNANGNSFEIPAAYRSGNKPEYTTCLLGFRVALYIK